MEIPITNTMRRRACAAFVLCAAAVVTLPAQTYTMLWNFSGTDGLYPQSLSQGTDGNLYGTTTLVSGGYGGTVFRITPGGALTTLYSFTGGADGWWPSTSLVLAADGNFYGTTTFGGAYANGTVFTITPGGALTTLYSFTGGTDGSYPGPLVLGANGNFYGTTASGGAKGDGTIFEVTAGGALITLGAFHSPKGSVSVLTQAINGNFYGTTYKSGTYNDGAIFAITPSGLLTTYNFTGGADGGAPAAGLVQRASGNFYGTTTGAGGAYGNGTVFTITPGGSLSTLYSFTGRADGASPYALVQANDGNLYGVTYLGGVVPSGCSANLYGFGCGTIFRISPTGALTTLHSFAGSPTDGAAPQGTLLQATDGSFYGTTLAGGNAGGSGYGTIFKLSMGLGPLVKTVPHAGKVGTAVTILGSNLTGATSVTFNGAPATFTVVSPTEIQATVPSGATSGQVQVTASGGVLSGAFLVIPATTLSPTGGVPPRPSATGIQ